jgi:hypothetical protein
MNKEPKPSTRILIGCALILLVLLLPLPMAAYHILKFLLSLGLLYFSGVFLQPCRNLMFARQDNLIEMATLDLAANEPFKRVTGTLKQSHSMAHVADINDLNSRIFDDVRRVGTPYEHTGLLPASPPISLPLCFGLVITAAIMNPLMGIHLPRTTWMRLDGLALGLLAIAWKTLQSEMAGQRPPVSLATNPDGSAGFQLVDTSDLIMHLKQFWPVVVGGTLVMVLLGSQIGGGRFGDITLYGLAAGTINGLLIGLMTSAAVLWVISWPTEHRQIPGVLGPVVFALILLGLVFSGHFSPKRLAEMDIPIPSAVPSRDEP